MSDKLRRILIGILALVFCVSAFHFGKAFLEYRKGDQIYENAMGFVVEAETPVEVKNENSVKRTYTEIDFTGIRAVNEDVIGWIQILNSSVDYPLLDADDNKYYLNHAYDRQWSSYGSIFLEPRNNSDLCDRHLVIYGHNMLNESMFASLLKYKKQEYADTHPEITICMTDKDLTYRVFSAYTAHVDSAAYRMTFGDDASFMDMAEQMKANSVIATDIMPTAEDQVLTLSTCTPEGAKKYRFIVNAVLVEDSSKAEIN